LAGRGGPSAYTTSVVKGVVGAACDVASDRRAPVAHGARGGDRAARG